MGTIDENVYPQRAVPKYPVPIPTPVSKPIEDTLKERGQRYGNFDGHANITQNIKNAMSLGHNWTRLSADKKEALEMIAHKIGRILNGDPNYKDSWTDIIGYAKLVENTLEGKSQCK